MMLPLDMAFGDKKVLWSTAEITAASEESMEFRLTQAQDEIMLKNAPVIYPNEDFAVSISGDLTRIRSKKHAKVNDRLVIRFAGLNRYTIMLP